MVLTRDRCLLIRRAAVGAATKGKGECFMVRALRYLVTLDYLNNS